MNDTHIVSLTAYL